MKQQDKMFLDTSFLFAYHNRGDKNHQSARNWYQERKDHIPHLKLIITDYIFDEIATLLLVRLNKKEAISICASIINDPITRLIQIGEKQFHSAWDIFRKMTDKNWSFTDCTSYVIMQEFGIDHAVSFDHRFKQFGFTILP